jgi:hypothetical protein
LAINDLVGSTLATAVTGKEAATTMHHAYSAQVLVARVLDWSKEWALLQMDEPPESPPSKPRRKALPMLSAVRCQRQPAEGCGLGRQMA